MTQAEQLVKEYLDYLEIEKNRARLTRAAYARYLTAFLALADIKTVRDITPERVRAFRLTLARRAPRGHALKKVTQNYYLIALRTFLAFLIKRGHRVLAPDEIELPRVPMRDIDIMDAAELERLLAAPAGTSLRELRNRAILETLFSTGLRLSELVRLDRYLDWERGEVTVRGKGEKLRVVFFSPEAKQCIRTYLAARTDIDQALFISITKMGQAIGRVSPRAVQRLIAFYARKAGISGKKVTPHALRHQFATDLLMNGADLRSVQELLGHASVTTTQIYTHLTNRALKEVHQAFHGRRRR